MADAAASSLVANTFAILQQVATENISAESRKFRLHFSSALENLRMHAPALQFMARQEDGIAHLRQVVADQSDRTSGLLEAMKWAQHVADRLSGSEAYADSLLSELQQVRDAMDALVRERTVESAKSQIEIDRITQRSLAIEAAASGLAERLANAQKSFEDACCLLNTQQGEMGKQIDGLTRRALAAEAGLALQRSLLEESRKTIEYERATRAANEDKARHLVADHDNEVQSKDAQIAQLETRMRALESDLVELRPLRAALVAANSAWATEREDYRRRIEAYEVNERSSQE